MYFTPPLLKVFFELGKWHVLCFAAYLVTYSSHKLNGTKAFDYIGFTLFHG